MAWSSCTTITSIPLALKFWLEILGCRQSFHQGKLFSVRKLTNSFGRTDSTKRRVEGTLATVSGKQLSDKVKWVAIFIYCYLFGNAFCLPNLDGNFQMLKMREGEVFLVIPLCEQCFDQQQFKHNCCPDRKKMPNIWNGVQASGKWLCCHRVDFDLWHCCE